MPALLDSVSSAIKNVQKEDLEADHSTILTVLFGVAA